MAQAGRAAEQARRGPIAARRVRSQGVCLHCSRRGPVAGWATHELTESAGSSLPGLTIVTRNGASPRAGRVKLRFRRDSATRKNSYAKALSKRANPCLAATTHLMLSRRSMQSAPEKAHSGRAGVGWDARCLVAAHAERGPPLRATPLPSEEPVVPPPGCSGRDQSGQLSGWLKRLFVPSFSARPMRASAPVMPFGSFFFSAFASAF